MRITLAVILALACGFLLYINAAMMFREEGGTPGWFVPLFFIGGSILAGFLLLMRTKRTSHVLKRGSLFGAVLWLALVPSSLILAGRGVAESEAVTGAERAGALVGGGIFAIMGAGLGVVMSALCLIVFVIVHFTTKEKVPDSRPPPVPTR